MKTRSDDDKLRIEFNLIDPYSVDNFLSTEEIEELIAQFESHKDKIYKNTGPVTCSFDEQSGEIWSTITDRIKNEIGDCKVYASFFFHVTHPHVIHNDDSFEFPLLHRGIALPLQLEHADRAAHVPSLCFFDQYYLDGPSKFFKGLTRDIPQYYNKSVTEYSDVYNKSSNSISDTDYEKYFTHLDREWLDELSIHSVIKWEPGNAIIFDNSRLHCASNFTQHNIKSKLGLSLFTQLM